MIKKNDISVSIIKSVIFYVLFLIYTILVSIVDVNPIGPENSAVGFSHLNSWFINMTGKNTKLYSITDLLAYIAFIVVFIFAVLGFTQLVKRKSIFKVDSEIYSLAFTYIILLGLYELFEKIIINYRPVLIENELEASYPSTHTMLALVVYGTALITICKLFNKSKILKIIIEIILTLCLLLCTVGRLLCGIHWLTDIIGSIFISAAVISSFCSINIIIKYIFNLINDKKTAHPR